MRNNPTHTDEELLALVANDNEQAFETLFQRHRGRLFQYLVRHTKSGEIAEEIVTDIFIKLWSGRKVAVEIENLSAFLFKVARYKALDFLRTVSRHKRLQQVYIDRAQQMTAEMPDDLLIEEELKELLLTAINQLPPRRQLVYRLSRESGMSHDEIASLLNLSKNTVNNTIVMATRSISDYLKKYAIGRAALTILSALFIAA